MGATFKEIAHKQIQEYKKQWFQGIHKQLCDTCIDIIHDAVWERLNNTDAHDFTGNLLNSIVVVLRTSSKTGLSVKKDVFYAARVDSRVKPASYVDENGAVENAKMTDSIYYFKRDYSGHNTAYHYTRKGMMPAEIVTNEGLGYQDALNFANSLGTEPKLGCLFEIVLAYTTEYASFVESKRQTIGAYATQNDAVLRFVELGLER